MHDEEQIPIWLFIGGILTVYGVLILGSGLYNMAFPPPPDRRVALFHLHADVWWGALMLAVGVFYCIRFRPHHHAIKPPAES